MTQTTLDQRIRHEVEHFDVHYADEAVLGIGPLSEFDKRRYTNPPANTIFPREYFYHLLSPMNGKRIMEIACGNGIDASISAYNGADVHAYDASEAAVELTHQRAAVNGVSDRVQLEVTDQFDDAFAGQRFHAIMGYAALHHLPLHGLAERVYQRLKPGGIAVFAEPVINSPALHRIRQCIPYSFAEDTEDEQPLDDADIARFARRFHRMVSRPFQCVSRIWPMFPNNFALAKCLHRIDHYLMKAPCLQRFATVVVFGLYRDR